MGRTWVKMRKRGRSRVSSGRHAPVLWSVWVTGPLALLVAGAGAAAVYWGLQGAVRAVARPVVDQFEILKATIGVAGFIGAVLAGVYAYRKQRLAEGDARRADSEQLADRYTKATEQMGHDSAAVRLGGLYAMARLADDWPEQRQTCIDVLCAYLRLPYEIDPRAKAFRSGERSVRLAILGIMQDRLQQGADSPTSWSGNGFDFKRARFDGGSFAGATFGNYAFFNGAVFTGDKFYMNGVTFDHGSSVSFYDVSFDSVVTFHGAKFSAGLTTFKGANFMPRGDIDFREALFGGTNVEFDFATFDKGVVDFTGARITASSVSFDDVLVNDADVRWGPFSVGFLCSRTRRWCSRLVDRAMRENRGDLIASRAERSRNAVAYARFGRAASAGEGHIMDLGRVLHPRTPRASSRAVCTASSKHCSGSAW